MGFFDLFKGGSQGGEKKKATSDEAAAAKYADTASNKRAQNYDRQEAIVALAEMKTPEAAAALMKRFTFNADPSITDQEEKQVALEGVLAAGVAAVDPVRAFALKAESLAWPMKILKELLEEEAYVGELLELLAKWDTEYAKFVDPKLQLLVELQDFEDERIRAAVEPFLEDTNETARFSAAATTFAQKDPAAVPALLKLLSDEESFRIKNKVCDGFIAQGWVVPEDQRDATRKALPSGYTIDGEGKLKKRDF
jgi:HEAT repeat protein